MMESHIFEYYLTLLQVQMAILGFVVAGLVTLMQMLNISVPKRQIRMLASPWELGAYVVSLTLLIAIVAIATWSTAFGHPTSMLVTFFASQLTGILLLILGLGSLLWFVYLIFRTKRLLDSRIYLTHYVARTAPTDVLAYVKLIYGSENVHIHETDQRQKSTYDPFQPIREYIKHNAQQQYDYGTAAGLKLFSDLFDKTFKSIPEKSDANDYLHLAKYLAESSTEFFRVFHKASSEKRKSDVIHLLHEKGDMFLAADRHDCLLVIIEGLEEIGGYSGEEDEIVEIIECVQKLMDSYVDHAMRENESWQKIADTFEETCLAMARLAETYYLQSDNSFRSVTPIRYYTGKTNDVILSLIDFYTHYKNLADLRIEAYPVHYFEAVESLAEVLLTRIHMLQNSSKATIGLNSSYSVLTEKLYDIYNEFAQDAIEHNRPDLLGLSLSNLRRVLKSASQFKLADERAALVKTIIELSLRATATLGNVAIKDKRTVSDYAVETIEKHASRQDIEDAFATLHETADIDFSKHDVDSLRSRFLN